LLLFYVRSVIIRIRIGLFGCGCSVGLVLERGGMIMFLLFLWCFGCCCSWGGQLIILLLGLHHLALVLPLLFVIIISSWPLFFLFHMRSSFAPSFW